MLWFAKFLKRCGARSSGKVPPVGWIPFARRLMLVIPWREVGFLVQILARSLICFVAKLPQPMHQRRPLVLLRWWLEWISLPHLVAGMLEIAKVVIGVLVAMSQLLAKNAGRSDLPREWEL